MAPSLRLLNRTILVVMVGLFAFEMLSLFSTPLVDSFLWWGDESWLMLEFKHQLLTGHFAHPFAFGASLHYGSGFILGSMWLTALLYGLPTSLFSHIDIALVGRVVTAVCSAGLLWLVYSIAKRLGASTLLALFATLLVETSRTFFLTSHSARYDIVTAAAILLAFYLLVRTNDKRDAPTAFWTGALIAAGLLISVHVVLAVGVAALVTTTLRSRRCLQGLLAFGLGALCTIGILFVVHLIVGTPALDTRPGLTEFARQLHDIPILRPFSRSVQLSNLQQRITLAMTYAEPLAILALLSLAFTSRKWWRAKRDSRLLVPIVILLSWLLLESSAPSSYLIYIVPVVAVCTALLLRSVHPGVIAVLMVALVLSAIVSTQHASTLGETLTSNNEAAVHDVEQILLPSANQSRTLVFTPALHLLLRDGLPVMTTQFVEFPVGPVDNVALVELLRQHGVRYLLLYRSALRPDYMREVQPLTTFAEEHGTPILRRVGPMTDIGREYFSSSSMLPDTLVLYQLHD